MQRCLMLLAALALAAMGPATLGGEFVVTPSATTAIAAVSPGQAIDHCLNGHGNTVPRLTTVTPAERDQLQTILDQQGTVQLERGDYHGSLSEIRLHSGQRILGVPSMRGRGGSVVPLLVVAAGTTNTVVDGVDPDGVVFSAGAATEFNCFARIHACHSGYGLMSQGASLETNIFLDIEDCLVKIDNRGGGYLRDNRFIRVKEQGSPAGSNQIDIRGDPTRRSHGNVLLWDNTLTPSGEGMYVRDQEDLSIVGVDAEGWNNTDLMASGSMLETGPMGTLRLMGFAGGDNTLVPTPILTIAADELQAYNMSAIRTPASPAMRFESTNQRSAVVDDQGALSPASDNAPVPVRLHADGRPPFKVTVDEHDPDAEPLTVAEQQALREMFVSQPASRAGQPWERPTFAPVPDPVAANRGNPHHDDTAYIQNLITTQGVASLPAGTYHISRPLVINHDQGLRGSGEGNTAIVATDPSIDMIIDGDRYGPAPGQPLQCGGTAFSFTLADLTLQGGMNGIHHDPYHAGGLATATAVVLSHVTFRNMTGAGIFVDNVLGWDNNWLDYVNFYHNGAGVRQRAQLFSDASCIGEAPYEGYLDKNVFYHSQFVGNGIALDLQATRQDDDNMWVNSLFTDNGQVLNQVHSVGSTFANSDFDNNGGGTVGDKGAPAVLQSDRPLTCVSCYFRADTWGGGILAAKGDAAAGDHCEGCTFARGTSRTAHIVAEPTAATPYVTAYLYNSRSTDMPVGPLTDGLLINDGFAQDPTLSQRAVVVRDRVARTLLSGASNPVPQLLFGKAFCRFTPGGAPAPAAAPNLSRAAGADHGVTPTHPLLVDVLLGILVFVGLTVLGIRQTRRATVR